MAALHEVFWLYIESHRETKIVPLSLARSNIGGWMDQGRKEPYNGDIIITGPSSGDRQDQEQVRVIGFMMRCCAQFVSRQPAQLCLLTNIFTQKTIKIFETEIEVAKSRLIAINEERINLTDSKIFRRTNALSAYRLPTCVTKYCPTLDTCRTFRDLWSVNFHKLQAEDWNPELSCISGFYREIFHCDNDFF